ncbi:hypothetical protein KPH14_008283 [Odynerus spinipes]|uniref:PNPLA domain-containing protein n=1 Tax=Odynerus spinipes TaxID=1348599 RepID=A0AAD9VLN1_9HYME|nr:hypothetical protein KPH14_008283 [Odynerus spinipes]
MSLNRPIRHCQRCISLTRQLTESAADKDGQRNVTNLTEKLLSSVKNLKKKKMSMQNQSKLLTQLKDYLNKSGYDKNFQVILSKYWIEMLQKIPYAQVDSVKKVSLVDIQKPSDKILETEKSKSEEPKDVLTVTTERKRENDGKTLNDNKIESKTIEYPKLQKKNFQRNVTDIKINMKGQPYTLSEVVAHLLLKVTSKAKESSLTSIPKWKKSIQSNMPKHSIVSRTRHILNSILTAESNTSKWRRIEDLLMHIDQYPEARHFAIKEGAIPILLKVRHRTKDEQIKASLREALAIMGHIDPPTGCGIKILSIDGGGIRGVLVLEMLKKLEELTGKKTHEIFDYICGVSTGAIIAASLGGHKRKSLDEISDLYKNLSTKVFTQSAIKGTSNLVWSHAYYDTALWEKLLKDTIGDKPLIKTSRDPNAPKFSAVSAVVNHARVMAYIFRNYTLPHRVESQYIGSHKHALWEAARASAAAPSYFEEFKHGENLHQDGGILVNNPCAVAIHEAKQLWPNNPIQCVVSFGTGRTPNKIIGTDASAVEVAISSWKEKFYKILDSATDTEGVHTMLNDLLPDHVYYRFNPYLTEMLSMVEIRPEKVSQLEQDAKMYIRRNEEKFAKAALALSKPKSIPNKFKDWVTLQKKMASL